MCEAPENPQKQILKWINISMAEVITIKLRTAATFHILGRNVIFRNYDGPVIFAWENKSTGRRLLFQAEAEGFSYLSLSVRMNSVSVSVRKCFLTQRNFLCLSDLAPRITLKTTTKL